MNHAGKPSHPSAVSGGDQEYGRPPFPLSRHLVWDATMVDTLALSYVQAAMAGAAAEIATERKNPKYSALLNTHVFVRSNQCHWPELSARPRSQADHVNRRQPIDLFLATTPLYHHTREPQL